MQTALFDQTDFGRSVSRRRFVMGAAGLAAALSFGRSRGALAASPTATLLASGESAIPADPFAWRLVRDIALPSGEAEPKERALGFVYSEHGLGIADVTNGSQTVPAGGAAFIPEGAVQAHESLSASDTDYLRFGLVPSVDAEYTAGGELLYGSEELAAPAGLREIELYRVDLGAGETFAFPASDAPILLHVLDGAGVAGVIYGSEGASNVDSGEPYSLMPGDSYLLRVDQGGDWGFGEGGKPASVLFAVIGQRIAGDVTDDESPIAEQGSGAILIQTFICAEPDSESGTCKLDESLGSLPAASLTGNGLELTLADIDSDEGDIGWLNLPYGDYVFAVDNDFWVETYASDEGAVGAPSGNTAVNYPVTITAQNPKVSLLVFSVN